MDVDKEKLLSQNYLIFTRSSELLMRENNGVEEDNFTRNYDIAAEDGDGGVQLATGVKQRIVLHLGEWFVGVGVVWCPLHPRPVTHTRVPANHGVNYKGMVSDLRISQDDTFSDSCSNSNPHVLADTDIGSQDSSWIHHCSLMDENITNNSWSLLILFFSQSFRMTCVVQSQEVSIGVNSTSCSLDLTPPIAGQIKEGGVGASDWHQNILLYPNCFSSVTVSSIRGWEVICLFGVEHILQMLKVQYKLYFEPK